MRKSVEAALPGMMRRLRIGDGMAGAEQLDIPNRETAAAMREAERLARDPSVRRYSDVEEALRELKR